MKENKNLKKINLFTMIILILILIVGVTFVIFNKNNNKNLEGNKAIQEKNKKNEVKKEYADTTLSFKFLKIENTKENIVYSPLSIKYALQMLKDGADGNTKEQIEKVIGDNNLVKYNNINNILSLANALYIRDTYSQYVKNEYKNKLSNDYNAEIKYDEFKSANNINNWIENKTFGQIKNMLQDDIVKNLDSEMFLINALAIDMEWKDKFEGDDTYGETFYLDSGKEIIATMMNQKSKSENTSYYKDDLITAITIDLKQYENEQMEFMAIMPNENLANYIENFKEDTLNNIINNLTLASNTKYGLNISIPRFSFNYDLALKNDLQKLGVTEAFNSKLANFSNMSTSPLWVDDALHKANIDFSEKGIKAAAVTIIAIKDNMMPAFENKPIEIKIDKPFMFLIRDKKTSEIWFIGAVYEPNLWENDKANYENR